MEEKDKITSLAANVEESYKKQLSDLQNKLAEQGKALSEAEKYVQQADKLATFISGNDKLKTVIREEYARATSGGEEPTAGNQQIKDNQKGQSTDMENAQIKSINERLARTEFAARERAVKEFEERTGLSKLSAEEKKSITSAMGKHLSIYGTKLEDIPTERVNEVLEETYKSVVTGKAIEEGNYEGAAAAYTNASASFGAMKGRSLEADESNGLTDGQKKMAEKYGLDPVAVEKSKDIGTKDHPFIPDAEKKASRE